MEKNLTRAIEDLLADSTSKSKWDIIKVKQDKIACTFNKLKEVAPEYYIPLRLACSVYLTYGAKNSNLILPYTVEEFEKAWIEIKPGKHDTSNLIANRFKDWLKLRGNHRFSEKSSKNFASFFEEFDAVEEFEKYKLCDSKKDFKKFWMKFKGVGYQYSNNLCMDEKNKHFLNSIKIDSRLNSLLKGTKAEEYTSSEKEMLFLNVSKNLKLTGWEIDRICFNFKDEIIKLLNN
jgi:hypothetical protein